MLFIHLAPVVRKVDNDTHRINLYPVDNAIGLPTTYPLESAGLSGGYRYQSFEQPGLGGQWVKRDIVE